MAAQITHFCLEILTGLRENLTARCLCCFILTVLILSILKDKEITLIIVTLGLLNSYNFLFPQGNESLQEEVENGYKLEFFDMYFL